MPSKQELKATEDMIFGKNRVQKSKVRKGGIDDDSYVAMRTEYVGKFKEVLREQSQTFDAFVKAIEKEKALREQYGSPDQSGRIEDIENLIDEIMNWGLGIGFYDEDLIAEFDDNHH